MGLFERKIRPAYVVPPAEPALTVPDEVRIDQIDIKLRSIAVIPRGERGQGEEWQTDRLLDLRNAIRPASHVDSIIDNRRENP